MKVLIWASKEENHCRIYYYAIFNGKVETVVFYLHKIYDYE